MMGWDIVLTIIYIYRKPWGKLIWDPDTIVDNYLFEDTTIATAKYIILKNAVTSYSELNI